MFEISVHPVPDAVRQRAYLNDDDYQRLYRQSVENPDEFWGEQAKAFLDWFKPWHSVHHGDLRKGQATWFKGGQLNVAYNCIDRHLERRGEQIAIVRGRRQPQRIRAHHLPQAAPQRLPPG